MGKLKNIPDGIRLVNTILRFNHMSKGIMDARAKKDPVMEREEIGKATKIWANEVARTFKMDIRVQGAENIPAEDGMVFISNHQGYADIIAMFVAVDGRQIGFIAKDNFESVPLLGEWIRKIRGLFIHRGNAKEALKSISDGAKLVKEGYNLVIYPEGTRSRSSKMGDFKPGSFKLATKAKAPIVPVTIDGTYHVYEEKGYAQPAIINVIIHPAVETKDLSRKELVGLEGQIEETIRSALPSQA